MKSQTEHVSLESSRSTPRIVQRPAPVGVRLSRIAKRYMAFVATGHVGTSRTSSQRHPKE